MTQSAEERAVATYKESEAYADELVEAGKFSYRLGSMDVFNKIQEKYPDIDMSDLKPDFGEAEGEASQNFGSTEADVQLMKSDVGGVQTSNQVGEALFEEVPIEGLSVEIPTPIVSASAEEVPTKGVSSEEFLTWSS